jgi:predicted RNA binding protein YcfA (HicA-like mRNA interferase family)
MKLPRDVDGPHLVKALSVLGYEATRQTGSHIRLTTQRDGENHEVVPRHRPIKAGTLNGILKSVAAHHGLSVDELLKMLQL